MSKAKKKHWGDWVVARSRVVGFKRKQDLARAVGCSANQISRWASLDSPPPTMLKGFDESLVRALITTKQVLFRDFVKISPADAVVENEAATDREARFSEATSSIDMAFELLQWVTDATHKMVAGEQLKAWEIKALREMEKQVVSFQQHDKRSSSGDKLQSN